MLKHVPEQVQREVGRHQQNFLQKHKFVIFVCPALRELALDLYVNFCVFISMFVYRVFFSRRLIG